MAKSVPAVQGEIALPARENNLNLIRLLLAVAVIYQHAYPVLYGSLDPFVQLLGSQLHRPSPLPMSVGDIAVNFFFVISGWLITASWERNPSWPDFVFKRVLRIYPAFIVAVLFSALVAAPLASSDPAATITAIPSHLVPMAKGIINLQPSFPITLQNAPNPHINGSLWTIHYEFRCYLLVAFLGTILAWARLQRPSPQRRALGRWAPALLFGAAYGLHILQMAGLAAGKTGMFSSLPPKAAEWLALSAEFQTHWPRLLTYFLAGMCLYAYRDAIHLSRPAAAFSGAVVVVAALAPPALPYVLPVFGSYAIMAVGFDSGLPLPKIPQGLDPSYGTYLYAFPVQQLLAKYLGTGAHALVHFTLASIIAVLLGLVSWLCIERPALRLKLRPRNPTPTGKLQSGRA
jgi:peptidoglycan/LPS O-acetylase OafA/YrhL